MGDSGLVGIARREFLRISSAIALGGLLYISPLQIFEQRLALAQANEQRQLSKTYVFDGAFSNPFLGTLEGSATLEIKANDDNYFLELSVYEKNANEKLAYSHISQGIVVNGRLLPEKVSVSRNFSIPIFKLFTYTRKDDLTFYFKHNTEKGRFLEVERYEKDWIKNISRHSTKSYSQSMADISTAIVQTLLDLKDGNKPDKLEYIDRLGKSHTVKLELDANSAVIDLRNHKYYFHRATIVFDSDYEPTRISLKGSFFIGNIDAFKRQRP